MLLILRSEETAICSSASGDYQGTEEEEEEDFVSLFETQVPDSEKSPGRSTESFETGEDQFKGSHCKASKGKKKQKDFVKRNIELVSGEGGQMLLTQAEKERLAELLREIDEEEEDSTRGADREEDMWAVSLLTGQGYTPEPSDLEQLIDIDSKMRLLLPAEQYLSVQSSYTSFSELQASAEIASQSLKTSVGTVKGQSTVVLIIGNAIIVIIVVASIALAIFVMVCLVGVGVCHIPGVAVTGLDRGALTVAVDAIAGASTLLDATSTTDVKLHPVVLNEQRDVLPVSGGQVRILDGHSLLMVHGGVDHIQGVVLAVGNDLEQGSGSVGPLNGQEAASGFLELLQVDQEEEAPLGLDGVEEVPEGAVGDGGDQLLQKIIKLEYHGQTVTKSSMLLLAASCTSKERCRFAYAVFSSQWRDVCQTKRLSTPSTRANITDPEQVGDRWYQALCGTRKH
ncbi:hypothetical protein INR49_032620 [Caranx melampygus]|nr:hypothetical protein INR49_032620 [Caranx melampygus]